MKNKLKKFLEKQIELSVNKRLALNAQKQSIYQCGMSRDEINDAITDNNNEFLATGGKITAFKQVLDFINTHP